MGVWREGARIASVGDALRWVLVASLDRLREGYRSADSFLSHSTVLWVYLFLIHFVPQNHNYVCLHHLEISLNRK